MFGKKQKTPWMTRHQLEVLDAIRTHGRSGVPLWFTDISLSSIRSLAKRGLVDTASRGRIVITRAGKHRLNQPWPAEQPTGDQKGRGGGQGSNVVGIGAPEATGEASVGETLTERAE